VYRAWDESLAREVALKIIRAPDAALGASVLREGQLLARVRHRNVVTVYGATQIGDEVGLWMELVRGRQLAQLVRLDGPMGPEEAAVIGISLCHALAAVHGAGLIHRDVKANNVMRESGGRIVLMDFGTGRDLTHASRGPGLDLSGTPAYMAPELFAGQPASPASDLYSLGVLLFHLVTGQYPVDGRTFTEVAHAHQQGTRRLLSDCRPDLPDGFVRVVERALASTPDGRARSAGAMMRELSDAMPGALADRAVPAGEQTERPVRPAGRAVSAARWIGGVVAAVLAIGGLGFLMCTAFDVTLERAGGFSDFTPVDWWLNGARSLVAPLVVAVVGVLAVRVLAAGWHVLRRAMPAAGRWADRARAATARTRARVGLGDRASAAQVLLLLQTLGVVLIVWRFQHLLAALMGYISTADAGALALLSQESPEPAKYSASVTLLLFGMVAAWWALLPHRGQGRPVDRATLAGGAAVIIVALLLREVPYCLLFQNKRPPVDYGGVSCYDIGTRGPEILLFCPAASHRVRVVRRDDPQVNLGEKPQNIFSPPGR
jgi:serine/threonine-protein kinase